MHSVTALAVLSALVPLARAHGQVSSVKSGSVTNAGPNVYYAPAAENKATVTRTMYKSSGPAYLLPKDFTDNSAMACEGAPGAPSALSVNAGDKITVEWVGATSELVGAGGLSSRFPWVHAMGSIIDYIAPCKGDCSTTDASNLGWSKIAQAGLDTSATISSDLRTRMTNKPEKYYPTADQGSGLWAMAKMIQEGSKWDITVPASLKNGQYIIRTELAAVHNPKTSVASSGPQLYVACVQVDVKNGGSASLPAGTKAGSLYDPNGAFANYNVYSDVYGFKLPGPALWNGASSGSDSGSGASSSTSKAADPTTTSKAADPTTTPKAADPTTTPKAADPTTTPKAADPTTSQAADPVTTSKTADATTSSPVPATTTSATTSSAPSASATRICKKRPSKKRSTLAKRAHKNKRRLSEGAH